jgi:GntR family transcriptional repressor for pyruvate dehydrogenase complex
MDDAHHDIDITGSDASPGQLHSRILPFIRQRGYLPGERIPSERELAIRFSVSRPVIREELSVLESMRVIERRPHSGIFLREIDREGSLDALVLEADLGIPMTPADVQSLNEFRRIIEIQAAEIACLRRTAKDIERIDEILRQTSDRIKAQQTVSDKDAEFHLAVCAATQNQILTRAANSFWLASKSRRDRYFADPRNARRSLNHHRQLLEAIVAQDTAAARDIMQKHLGKVENYWMETLNKVPADTRPARSGPKGRR